MSEGWVVAITVNQNGLEVTYFLNSNASSKLVKTEAEAKHYTSDGFATRSLSAFVAHRSSKDRVERPITKAEVVVRCTTD